MIKSTIRNFAKFPGKYLCQNLFLNKFAGLFCETSKSTFFTEHLWTTAYELSSLIEFSSFTYILIGMFLQLFLSFHRKTLLLDLSLDTLNEHISRSLKISVTLKAN